MPGRDNSSENVREKMKHYWEEHSHEATEQEMMLDEQAERLGQMEKPEILNMLPDLRNKRVLDLGAGIGRFTGQLAKRADHVTAVEFMETFLEENKKRNSEHNNITYKLDDVTSLEMEPNSVDFIFSNWLFMYLSDEEIRDLACKMLGWLTDGGKLFFRESCFHKSGDKRRGENPTVYRSPASYNDLFQSTYHEVSSSGFETIFIKPVQTYIQIKNNSSQLCWLLSKSSNSEGSRFRTFQEFLDNQQYSRNSILRYEKIFGEHFISTGGKDYTERFVTMLDLKKGQKVLDVGSGIGGSAFYMAEKYGVDVTGIDLSTNMVAIAFERLDKIKDDRVRFEVADATTRDFPDEIFDVVYSRDTILHIPDKLSLFKSFLRWLKPGGKLMISDYCCSDGNHSEQFKQYVKQRGYILLSPAHYGKVLQQAGFVNVDAKDRTEEFVDALKTEIGRISSIKEDFIQEFSREDYDAIVNGWKDKQERCAARDQRWGLFTANKENKY